MVSPEGIEKIRRSGDQGFKGWDGIQCGKGGMASELFWRSGFHTEENILFLASVIQ